MDCLESEERSYCEVRNWKLNQSFNENQFTTQTMIAYKNEKHLSSQSHWRKEQIKLYINLF